MSNENSLDNIIKDVKEENEAEIDKTAADIFGFSAKMKKDLKLVKDPNGFELYYLSISPNNTEYLEKIKSMDLSGVDMLYAALKHPVMFADVAKRKAEYFNQDFEGLDIKYNIMTTQIDDNEAKRLSDLYLKAKEVETEDDLKYAKMYDVSYKIKDKAVKVVLVNNQKTLEFYLTELSELGEDGKKIIDYLSSLKDEDASYFISVSSLFSIIDLKNNVLYAMESSKGKDGKETVKMSVHDKKDSGFGFIYDIAERAKKNPKEKVFLVDQNKEETYHPNSKPPSDMYA